MVILTIVLTSRFENFYDFQFHAAVQLKATRFKYLLFVLTAKKADKFQTIMMMVEGICSVTIKCRSCFLKQGQNENAIKIRLLKLLFHFVVVPLATMR